MVPRCAPVLRVSGQYSVISCQRASGQHSVIGCQRSAVGVNVFSCQWHISDQSQTVAGSGQQSVVCYQWRASITVSMWPDNQWSLSVISDPATSDRWPILRNPSATYTSNCIGQAPPLHRLTLMIIAKTDFYFLPMTPPSGGITLYLWRAPKSSQGSL